MAGPEKRSPIGRQWRASDHAIGKEGGTADIIPEPTRPNSLLSVIGKGAQPKPSLLTTMAECWPMLWLLEYYATDRCD